MPEYGSVYDFDADGAASWHLPVLDDLPGGADNHGSGHAVPVITEGDLRQRTILYALSRLGCSYALDRQPEEFVCDGLTEWAYRQATGERCTTSSDPHRDYVDASFQWDLIKSRGHDPWQADVGTLRPGDLLFFGQQTVAQGGGSIDYDGAPYHAGMYYRDGLMINARASGVQLTDIDWYAREFMPPYLGGGSPYAKEACRFEVPHL